MTALALVQSGWARSSLARRVAILAAVVLAALLAAAAVVLLARADASSAAQMPPEKAAILLEAASGDAVQDFRAVGDEAKVINAALPFSAGPILRADPFRMTGADLDQRRAELCLTQAVYYEAGFEPMEGRRAVAQVVLNRTRHPAYPKSVCGVVYQRSNNNICQFTFVCDGALYRAHSQARWIEAQQRSPRPRSPATSTQPSIRTHFTPTMSLRAGADAGQGRKPASTSFTAGLERGAAPPHFPVAKSASRAPALAAPSLAAIQAGTRRWLRTPQSLARPSLGSQ